jgi:release factor glutamine methyltransferase
VPSIAETIRRVQSQIAGSEPDSPRLDAEMLIGHILGQSRSDLLADLPEPFPDDCTQRLDELVARRAAGEPIALIIGQREFFGLIFTVSPNVLTPRPETEHLVEWALAWLQSRPDAQVIDIGTGSGAIAIALAANSPASVAIVATDRSAEALAIARRNAESLAPHRIDFAEGDLLADRQGTFDLVVANLPYLTTRQISERPELAFEPAIALDGGRDGLDTISRLIALLPQRLKGGGAVALEIDPAQAPAVAQRLTDTLPGAQVQTIADLTGRSRVVTAVRL